MIDSFLRSPYQRLAVHPFAKLLCRLSWLRAMHVTFFGALIGLAVLPLLMLHRPLLAVTALLISGYCDTLDGSIARLQNHASPQGAALDIFVDRLVEAATIIGLFFIDPLHRGIPCLLMLASTLLCITSFLVVGIFSANQSTKSFHYSPGLIERTEAFVLFIAMILFPGFFPLLAALFTTLVTVTAFLRLLQFISAKQT